MGVRNFFKGNLENRVKTIGKGLLFGLSAFGALAAFGTAAEAGGVYANGSSGRLFADSSYHSQTYSRPNYTFNQYKRVAEQYRQQKEQREGRMQRGQGLYATAGTGNESSLFANSGRHSPTWRRGIRGTRLDEAESRRLASRQTRQQARQQVRGGLYAGGTGMGSAAEITEDKKEKEKR
ncbi:hypothetical protein GF371_03130, partial [Candidatus Woesearchaeota archaeon]|nr:hypothetical protein [Candidatus Woesearchaeota archaeon]